MVQGDDYDSSDEEWEEHIGRHARAFLGLVEPVSEIALDEGVGVGMMVRNAFVHADTIHTRACGVASSSNGVSSESEVDPRSSRGGQPDGVNITNVHRSAEDIDALRDGHHPGSAVGNDPNYNSLASMGTNEYGLANSGSQESSRNGGGSCNGDPNAQDD